MKIYESVSNKIDREWMLNEMPYFVDGSFTAGEEPMKNFSISKNGLSREYIELVDVGKKFSDIHDMKVFQNKQTKTIIVVKSIPNNDLRMHVIVKLEIKSVPSIDVYPDDINPRNIVQVDGVEVDHNMRSYGMTSMLYISLAQAGRTVLSDTHQFADGKELWMKISAESRFSEYIVRVLNGKTGEYFKDNSGEVITYDASNIDSSLIWSRGKEQWGQDVVFVLTA